MKLHGIKARGKRKYVVTTDSRHNQALGGITLKQKLAFLTDSTTSDLN
jgi:hypothetical protein